MNAIGQSLILAWRNLGRNRRRSILSSLAVAAGLSLLVLMASVLKGEMRGAMENTIQLYSSHLQIRDADYNEEKVSLHWDTLIEDPEAVMDQLRALPQVSQVTARLLATGIVAIGEQSRGVQVVGIDPDSEANQLFRQGIVTGEFLGAEDREGVLIGLPLARKIRIGVGDQINVLINRSDGSVDEQRFTVRGVYTTRTNAFDQNTVFMPLAKLQAFAEAGNHVSTILVYLHDREQAQAVAAAIGGSGYQVLTWQQMNEVIVQTEKFANAYMIFLYLIVLGITATVVTNTLVMSVFERTREIGVLSAIGMKGRRIMLQFLAEAALLATGGVIGGMILGALFAYWFYFVGFNIENFGMTGILMSNTIRSYLTAGDMVRLAIITYVVTLLAALYPATLAARLEPIEALHAE